MIKWNRLDWIDYTENEPQKTLPKIWLIDIEFEAIEWIATGWIFHLSAFEENQSKKCALLIK